MTIILASRSYTRRRTYLSADTMFVDCQGTKSHHTKLLRLSHNVIIGMSGDGMPISKVPHSKFVMPLPEVPNDSVDALLWVRTYVTNPIEAHLDGCDETVNYIVVAGPHIFECDNSGTVFAMSAEVSAVGAAAQSALVAFRSVNNMHTMYGHASVHESILRGLETSTTFVEGPFEYEEVEW